MSSLSKSCTLVLIALFLLTSVTEFFAVPAYSKPTWNTQLVEPAGAGGSIAIDSSGNPHIVYTYWYIVDDSSATRMNYAVWTGANWTIQTIDPSGGGGTLMLDSKDRPHVVYTADNSLKYAVLNGNSWNIQTIDSSESPIFYSMALDSNGNPHVAYFTYHSAQNNVNGSETEDLKYAVWNGSSWNIQTIDRVNVFVDAGTPSIVLDSKNYPHILYDESVVFKYYNQYTWNNLSFYSTDNIKYASWTGKSWQIQTVVSNSTENGNLVLNSNQQPSFYYIHESFTYNPSPNYNSFKTTDTPNYVYWNGHNWLSRTIDTNPFPFGQTFLKLDSSGNPNIYFYNENYQNESESSLMDTHLTGSSWNNQNLGGIPLENSQYYPDTENIADIAFNSQGKISLTYDGEVGTIRSAPIDGDLTYATIEDTGINPALSSLVPLTIIAAIIVSVIIAVSLLRYIRHRKL